MIFIKIYYNILIFLILKLYKIKLKKIDKIIYKKYHILYIIL